MSDKKEIEYSISLIRLIAFLMIFSCHVMQYLGNEFAWWFNVGVEIFLCISGYLYGKKQIIEPIMWYGKQFKKILIPYYIVVIPVVILHLCCKTGSLSILTIGRVLLCNATLDGGGHLWFIPMILMCYLITPLLEAGYVYFFKEKRIVYGVFFCVIIIAITYGVFLQYFHPARITCYALGYLIGKGDFKWLKRIIAGLSTLNIIQIFFDYVFQVQFSGNIEKVYNLWCRYNHVWLGITLFMVLKKILDNIDMCKFDGIKRICFWGDKYSYEAYLVHQFLILGPFTLMEITNSRTVNIILIFIFTLCLSVMVKMIADIVLMNITIKRSVDDL